MLEHHSEEMNDRPPPSPTERRGPRSDRRHVAGQEGQADRRRGPADRRQSGRLLDPAGRRRGPPDRRAASWAAQAPLSLGQDLLPQVSHALRTPLTTIQGYAALLGRRLRQQGEPSNLVGPVRAIDQQAHRLGALVDELLDLSELSQPDARLQLRRFDLAALAHEAVAEARTRYPAHRFTLETEPALFVRGDLQRLRQVLDELLANAVKYSLAGGEIRVQAWSEDGRITLSVADNGPGLAPEHVSRCFEPFFQAHPEDWHRHGGLGLGLTLCRVIVERHGGHMWVQSAPGRGSVFYAQLAAAPAPR
ncbi:MAG TPA: ATP-binding protein [Chloroflexota bacterium]|nr:ATP-binding protein [Chloroflexota bacterium]